MWKLKITIVRPGKGPFGRDEIRSFNQLAEGCSCCASRWPDPRWPRTRGGEVTVKIKLAQARHEEERPVKITDLLDDHDRGFRLKGKRGDSGSYRAFDWPATSAGWMEGMASVAEIDAELTEAGRTPTFYDEVRLVAPKAPYTFAGIPGHTMASFNCMDGDGTIDGPGASVQWDISLLVTGDGHTAELPDESVRWLLQCLCKTLTVRATQDPRPEIDCFDMELKRAVYNTYWPGALDPKANPTAPPEWWLNTRDRYEVALASLERLCDEVLDVPEGEAERLRVLATNYWLFIGRVHGILGNLPIGLIRYPTELEQKMNVAGARLLIAMRGRP